MKEVTLDAVKYAKCQCCGRGFPRATWIQPLVTSHLKASKEIDMFKPNNNAICKPCIDIKLA